MKYCVYLKGMQAELLTPEEQDFMKTMAEVDTWYETEINKAKLEGQLEGEARGKELEKQGIALKMLLANIPLETIAQVTGLTIEQLEKLSSLPNE